MDIVASPSVLHCTSRFLAMAFDRATAMVAQFGVESGGRLRRHIENNLLRPGLGMVAGRRTIATLAQDGQHLSYRCADGLDWDITFPDERTCRIRLSRSGGRIGGTFFRMAFAPDACPVSVFGDPLSCPDFPVAKGKESVFEVPEMHARFRVPLLLHFPDQGSLRLVCASAGVTAVHSMRPNPEEAGLNLGCFNTQHHTQCFAYHRGTAEVALVAAEEMASIEFELQVLPEIHPLIPGVDLSGSQWNGLRRCWMNTFQLNPATLTMGDNLVMHGVAHLAIHFKSDQAQFTPALLPGLDLHRFLGRALEITFRDCVGPQGHIADGYAERNRQHEPGTAFFDGCVSNMIALRNHIAATGDWFIALANADNLARAGRYLLSLDSDDDGILEMPFHGNAMGPGRDYRNWWDNFPFGHKDAWLNLLAYRALGDLAAILTAIGRSADAALLQAWRRRFAASFDRTFRAPSGVHAGWISADGRMHDYMFTFISAMAINQGIIVGAQAREILGTLLAKLRSEGFGSWEWGIPGPLISVHEADEGAWMPMQRWGSYENGGFCGMTAQHLIQALYTAGMRDEADRILFTMLATFEREATHSGVFPGYMKSVDWRTIEGRPCGYNYLADNYHFLLSGITGHHGVSPPSLQRRPA